MVFDTNYNGAGMKSFVLVTAVVASLIMSGCSTFPIKASLEGEELFKAFSGYPIGKSLDQNDVAYANQAALSAFEASPAKQPLGWRNPVNGHSGTITAASPYRAEGGKYCREYWQTVLADGHTWKAYGAACRQSNGNWVLKQRSELPVENY